MPGAVIPRYATNYLVAAISAVDQANWLDREFLSVAATAARLRVEPDDTVTQHLRARDRG